MNGGAQLGGGFSVSLQRTAEDASDGVDGDNLRVHTGRESARETFVGFETFLKARETLLEISDLRILLQ